MNLKTKFLGVNKIEKNFSLGTLILQLFFLAKVIEHNAFLIYDGMQLDVCSNSNHLLLCLSALVAQ